MSDDERGYVLVTGASTGIGFTTAMRLDAIGYRVFAGVRRDEDGANIKRGASLRLQPILLDVTNDEQVKSAIATISETVGDHGLAGLVNNAGIAVAGPMEFIPMERFIQQFDVNVFGVMRVTQACIPLIRKAKGRIVNISSIAGLSASPVVGPYTASKHALEAMTDALRVELYKWGIHVSAVEPGAIKTPIWDKGARDSDDLEKQMPPEAMDLYGSMVRAMRDIVETYASNSTPPERVTDAVVHALTANPPRPRYLVGNDARIRLWLEKLPTRYRDSIVRKRLGC